MFSAGDQPRERAAEIRAKIEKGIAGPRAFSDSYVVNGHRVYVYPPRHWLRTFARPPLDVPAMEVAGIRDSDAAGHTGKDLSQPRARLLKASIDMDRSDPLYTPSILPHHQGFMRDAGDGTNPKINPIA